MKKEKRHHSVLTEGGTIIIAAQEGAIGDWTAYIRCFAGLWREDYMVKTTLREGEKIPQSWAAAMFPVMDLLFTWRP